MFQSCLSISQSVILPMGMGGPMWPLPRMHWTSLYSPPPPYRSTGSDTERAVRIIPEFFLVVKIFLLHRVQSKMIDKTYEMLVIWGHWVWGMDTFVPETDRQNFHKENQLKNISQGIRLNELKCFHKEI